jgi:hypothetical protein
MDSCGGNPVATFPYGSVKTSHPGHDGDLMVSLKKTSGANGKDRKKTQQAEN